MAVQQVLGILVDQAGLVRSGSGLSGGRLSLFRQAIQMEGFPEVVRCAKLRSGCNLFSTLEEIELMENDYHENRSDLVVQCFLILDFAMSTYQFDARYMSFQRSMFFDHCRTLEDIAHLSFRLNFIAPESELRPILEDDINDAVRKCVTQSEPTWRDVLLIFKMAAPRFHYQLVMSLAGLLSDEWFEIPALAATLLLSFVAEAVRGRNCLYGDMVAERLLKLDASPMVSVDDHDSLFRAIHRNHFPTEQQPWWLEAQGSEPKTARRSATALSRLLGHNTSAELRHALEQKSCCNLDSKCERSKVFPTKLSSLKCIAARHLADSDLETLSGRLKFITSKHVSSLK